MKIDLFDTKEFIDINKLKEVKSGILFQRGNIPHPEGLISNEIFGITIKSRKETFAYIKLNGHFFHPHIYKAIKRLFRNVEKIISGEEYYTIDKNGQLIKDDAGETGIEFLYNNWEKIKWNKSDKSGMRNERIDLITKTPKNIIFTEYQIVVPAFYRDITSTSSGSNETSELNKFYARLIRLANFISDRNMFDFELHSANANIQNTMIEIYDYFKTKIEKKNGLIRKYLMGKNVDYSTRTVITAPYYHANTPDDIMHQYGYVLVPISQVCSLCYPFVLRWVKSFFEREIIDNKNSIILYDPNTDTEVSNMKIVDPESIFDDKYIKKLIDMFIKDPESRFNKITVPVENGKSFSLAFRGYRTDESTTTELSPTVHRAMTWTDLLFMASYDVTKDKYAMITRYPVSDEFGIFIAKVRVSSTMETIPLHVGERIYKWYPKIDMNTPKRLIATKFIDSVTFSNSYLKGITGDYDGDQTTIKIIFSQEANEECKRLLSTKSTLITSTGKLIRFVESEPIQTFYSLSKPIIQSSSEISQSDKEWLLNLKPSDITLELLIDMFSYMSNIEDGKNSKINNPKFFTNNYFTITPSEYHVKEKTKTTVGRFILNKVIFEKLGLENIVGYVNDIITASKWEAIEGLLSSALLNDKITVQQVIEYIDVRDWLGFSLHPFIASSFTKSVLSLPKEAVTLRKKLYKDNEEALKNGDVITMSKIEKEVIAKVKDILKDDPGLELYLSGARGSMENNYKNIFIGRGAVKDTASENFDIITRGFMDGLDKKDFPSHSNSILAGAYPKAVGTAETGALSKGLMSAYQSDVLDEKGSDCGTKKTLTVTITPKNINDYLYRYIKVNGKPICITDEYIEKNINGKSVTVEMYSPMYCIGDKICNKCAGDLYYKMDKLNIGLSTSRIATTLTNLNMKKFHNSQIKIKKININDIL